jgi:tetratricopeptide (TPR) repeat protein
VSAANREQFAKLLTETDVYVKYGLHDKALEHLRKIFNVDPENLDAHEKAYHIYVAAQNQEQAHEQLLNVLRLCTRGSEVERAQPYLASILRTHPDHPEVPAFLAVLRTDATEVPDIPAPVEASGQDEDAILVDSNEEEVVVAEAPPDALAALYGNDLALATASVRGQAADDEVEPEAQLLMPEEAELAMGDDEPLAVISDDEPLGYEEPEKILTGDIVLEDGDVAAEAEPYPATETLVEPPQEVADDDALALAAAEAAAPETLVAAEDEDPALALAARADDADEEETTDASISMPAEPELSAQPDAAAEDDAAAEECAEASFFLDQGLIDEAREILETVVIAYPDHPAATELLARLEQMVAAGAQEPEPEAAPEAPPPSVTPVAAEESRDAFDLAAELAADFDDMGGETVADPPMDDFQYSVDEVFSEFKKGLAKVVKPEDVDTHYDLGIAYKEMGLIDDAIQEFAVARQGCEGKKKEVDCLTMIAMLQVMKGDAGEAVASYRQALGTEHATGEAAKALEYELGLALETQGEAGKALYHFQRVAKLDPGYRDVTAQVQRLAATTQPEEDPLPGRAANGVNGTPGRGGTGQGPKAGPPGEGSAAAKARKVGYV